MAPKEKETVEEVTVETPKKTEEEVKETVTGINPAPADNPTSTTEEVESTTNVAPQPLSRRSRRTQSKLTPQQRVEAGEARAEVHRDDEGTIDQNLVNRYNAGEGHVQLTEEQQKEALANKKEGAQRFDEGTIKATEEQTIEPPIDPSTNHVDAEPDTPSQENNPETAPTANLPQGTEGSSALEGRDAEGVAEESEEEPEAGSEENAEGVAEEIQALDPNTIPTDPDDFQAWVQSKPELKNFYDFMINDSDAKLKASQRKERREAAGVALGNLVRAFTNLVYTTKGSPNAYNNEEADKVTEGVHTHFDRWRKQLEDNRKERWEQYQKLRNQYAQERQQRHKEAMDTENLKLAQEKNLRERMKNDAQLALIYQQASKAEQDAIKAAIDAGDEAELNRLKMGEIKSRTRKNDTSAANDTRRTNIAEKEHESKESLRKTQEGVNRAREKNLLEGNDDNPLNGGNGKQSGFW